MACPSAATAARSAESQGDGIRDSPLSAAKARTARACDQCRQAKHRCYSDSPDAPRCTPCTNKDRACTYLRVHKKRGRQPGSSVNRGPGGTRWIDCSPSSWPAETSDSSASMAFVPAVGPALNATAGTATDPDKPSLPAEQSSQGDLSVRRGRVALPALRPTPTASTVNVSADMSSIDGIITSRSAHETSSALSLPRPVLTRSLRTPFPTPPLPPSMYGLTAREQPLVTESPLASDPSLQLPPILHGDLVDEASSGRFRTWEDVRQSGNPSNCGRVEEYTP